jgi:hypothetical protein
VTLPGKDIVVQKILLLMIVSSLALPRAARADETPLSLGQALLKAIQLPLVAEMARRAEIDPDDVKAALTAAVAKKVPAEEMTDVLEAGVAASEVHGPIDNFGAFVQARLDEGMRGRDLADAIRREHVSHGHGKLDRDKKKKSKDDK